MSAILALVTLAVAAALSAAAWLRPGARALPKGRRRAEIALIVAACVMAAWAIALGIDRYQERQRENAEIEDIVGQVRRMTFVGPVLDEVPEARDALWGAIRERLRAMPREEIVRMAAVAGRQLRYRHGAATLRAADDVSILSAWLARTETVLWLAEHDVQACAAFVLDGIVPRESLGRQFDRVFNRYLEALAMAYADGHGKLPQRVLEEETFDTLLLGYAAKNEAEADVLNDPNGKTAQAICNTGVSVATGLDRIPVEQQVAFARHFLTVPR